MEPGTRISIVDDDENALAVCRYALDGAAYDVATFRTLAQALENRACLSSDLAIVDLGLWQAACNDVREQMLARNQLIISGRQDLFACVLAHNPEADDYIVKPFHPLELVARIESVLRRGACRTSLRDEAQSVRFADWAFDIGTLQLIAEDGRSARLTSAEAGLLTALLRSPHRILTRDQLLQSNPLGDEGSFERSVDVLISRLRKKIESDIRNPKIIRTVYGVGYSLSCEVKWIGARARTSSAS